MYYLVCVIILRWRCVSRPTVATQQPAAHLPGDILFECLAILTGSSVRRTCSLGIPMKIKYRYPPELKGLIAHPSA
ncbi:hypothetical protein F5Y09DRAFT_316382 [Xylaria sp. FL1042]|nr:hypothetical protein F5Y09DRAFT_316382 [Xylaria sp. FL1042]